MQFIRHTWEFVLRSRIGHTISRTECSPEPIFLGMRSVTRHNESCICYVLQEVTTISCGVLIIQEGEHWATTKPEYTRSLPRWGLGISRARGGTALQASTPNAIHVSEEQMAKSLNNLQVRPRVSSTLCLRPTMVCTDEQRQRMDWGSRVCRRNDTAHYPHDIRK